jgi:hypothetical protein
MNNDDDDVRSGNFHPELREQFQNANPAEKTAPVANPN